MVRVVFILTLLFGVANAQGDGNLTFPGLELPDPVAWLAATHAFVTGNYAIKYVQRYSDAAQPLAYQITSYWGGLDGSIMFWVFLLAVFGTVAVATNRERHRELIPWVVAVISAVEMFFIFIMVVHNNPFSTFVAASPADGKGLNPLLQNFYMAIHPPSLYIGFVAMTIPYAFGMAALITGHLDDAWLRAMLAAESALARARGQDELAEAIAAAEPDPRELGRLAAESGNPVVPLVAALREQGWMLPDAQANFVWFGLGSLTAEFAAACEAAGLTVRPYGSDGARATIGEREANDRLIAVAGEFWTSHRG